jgi:hypothetical protein
MKNSKNALTDANQSLFLSYSYFFAIFLVIVNNSLVSTTSLVEKFVAFFYQSAQPGFLDASILIGNLFSMPLLVFLFGIPVYNKIHSSSPVQFLQQRFISLLPWFIFSAIVTMPISYYLLESNNGHDSKFWHYITETYFKNWLTGPSWILAMILAFDTIIVAFCQFASPITNNLFALVKNAKVFKTLLALFLVSVVVFFLTSEFSGSIKFFALPSEQGHSWFHIGPVWLQKNALLSYFIIYFFSALLGSSNKFLEYILSSKSELSSKWMNKILETTLLYLAIKFMANKATLFNSTLALNIILSLAYMLLMFSLFSTFFSILSRFAYKKSRFLTAISEYSIMIYLLHFLPLVIIKNYSASFHSMTDGQKTYIILIFTFCISLVLSYLLKKLIVSLKKTFKCEHLCK